MPRTKLGIYDDAAPESAVLEPPVRTPGPIEARVMQVLEGPLSHYREARAKVKAARDACSSCEDDVIPGVPAVWATVWVAREAAYLTGRTLPRLTYPLVAFGAASWLFYPTLTAKAARFTGDHAKQWASHAKDGLREWRAAQQQQKQQDEAPTSQ